VGVAISSRPRPCRRRRISICWIALVASTALSVPTARGDDGLPPAHPGERRSQISQCPCNAGLPGGPPAQLLDVWRPASTSSTVHPASWNALHWTDAGIGAGAMLAILVMGRLMAGMRAVRAPRETVGGA
jgi:hypothetical protein